MASDTETREYMDNASVKEFIQKDGGLIDKYFEDIDVSLRTVGTIGYTTELVSNIAEDTFNAASVLFRETFVNRAQIPESIYSHAALFQIDETFSAAASCTFLMVLEEKAIIQNMIDDVNTDIYHFYIGKNTTIYVENLPFTLDYDIRMDIAKKHSDTGEDKYIYTARYITTYQNSISDITDPFIKIRRSSDGFIALEVHCHQCLREEQISTILTNTEINYETIDVPFDGKLAGFDVLYKPANSTNDFSTSIKEVYEASPNSSYWYTLDDHLDTPDDDSIYTVDTSIKQMKKLLIYSQPLSEPFCYYQLLDDNTIRLSFNTKDRYFMPEFNSEVKIILYITNGKDGNFDIYNGTNISLIPDNETAPYANSYLTAAQPVGASSDGRDQMNIDGIQSLAAEGYRTALALTTDNDLQEYFNNYKYRFGDSNILFIKKRDDIYERVFSAYIIMRNNDFIYKTNTLNLNLNLYDMENSEKDVFMLNPGQLFTADDENLGYAKFFRDEDKSLNYKNRYEIDVRNGKAPFINKEYSKEDLENLYKEKPYYNRACSFAEWKSRNKLDDRLNIFDIIEKVDEVNVGDTNTYFKFKDGYEKYDDPFNKKFLYFNPFLLRFTKSPNLVSAYLTYINNSSAVDFVAEDESSYVQFILNVLHVDRAFEKQKRYHIYATIGPSISVDTTNPVIATDPDGPERINYHKYSEYDKYDLENNDTRVVAVISDGTHNVCYIELYPTDCDVYQNMHFDAYFNTNDHITSDGKLRLLADTIYRNKTTGEYYKAHDDNATLYNHYDKMGVLLEDNVPNNNVTQMVKDGKLYKYSNIKNMLDFAFIQVPLRDVNIKIYTLYRKHYSAEANGLVENEYNEANNIFVKYDKTFGKYKVTNEYNTIKHPITFVQPLDNVRTALIYKDYRDAYHDKDGQTQYVNDIYDCTMYSLSFVRASSLFNTDVFNYFLNSFYSIYNQLSDIMNTRLRNITAIDTKFYNTYGRSKNFYIGDEEEVLDTVNLRIYFDMWFTAGTDLLEAVPQVKEYIKNEIETVNNKGTNSLYISNLMRKVENHFAFVDHIRFKSINGYDSKYQAVKNKVPDINDLSVQERRFFVPELLVTDIDDIVITEYYAS